MAITEDSLSIYSTQTPWHLPTLWHISGWTPPSNKPAGFFAWCWSADWRRDSHTCQEAQIYQCAWKSGYPLRPKPCTLCAHMSEVQPAFLSDIFLIAQLDVVMTSWLMVHSCENPLLFKSTLDWAVSIPAMTPDCHLWKLISQKSIPSFPSRIVLCTTNSATQVC